MVTTVERIARAIYEKRNGYGCGPFERREKSHREPYLSDARSALRALTEPTGSMLKAATAIVAAEGKWQDLYVDEETATQVWQVMLSAALSEAEEPR